MTQAEEILFKTLRLLPEVRRYWHGSATEAESIGQLASSHLLGALLYRSLGRLELLGSLPEPVRARLRDTYLAQAARAEYVLREMIEIKKIASAAGVRVIFLKGLVAAVRIHDDIAARNFCDIDILVRLGDIRSLHEGLLGSDYRRMRLGQSNRLAMKYALNHWVYRKPKKMFLEVHWKLHHYPFFRTGEPEIEPGIREILIRDEPFSCLDDEHEILLQLFSAVSEPSLRRLTDIAVMLGKMKDSVAGGWKGFFERRRRERTACLAADRMGAALWMAGARDEFPELRGPMENALKGSFDRPPRVRPPDFFGRTLFKLRLFGNPWLTVPWWIATAVWRKD